MQKVAVFTVVVLVLSIGLVAPMEAGQVSTLRPGLSSSDVKVLKKPHLVKSSTAGASQAVLSKPTGIIDTLRAYTGIGGVNFGFGTGDSMLIWLQPQAACSL